MDLIVAESCKAAAIVARAVIDQLRASPASVLGLATGATMEAVYGQLRNRFRAGHVSFASATSFNLDEYIGLPPSHPGSYRSTMQRLLFEAVDIDLAKLYLPDSAAERPDTEADRYECLIRTSGGIDLQLLGIGRNGHIGFNEPGSPLDSRTRVVTLAEETRDANRQFFPPGEQVPGEAVTMGVATILDARKIVLLAIGIEKAEAVAAMISGPISTACPASALQRHSDVLVVADPAAASLLRNQQLKLLDEIEG